VIFITDLQTVYGLDELAVQKICEGASEVSLGGPVSIVENICDGQYVLSGAN
jgi:malonyl CoA-acyl carrier protein transacylase